MKILVINPGATSTKIAVFDEDEEVMKQTIDHSAADLEPFRRIIDQAAYRKERILATLETEGWRIADFSAVCGRGGLLKPISSGTYAVNESVVDDIVNATYGEHASNLGAYLAKELADEASIPSFFVDPVCVDEMSQIAHMTGFKRMRRVSFFHALNHKSIARKAAAKLGKTYEELNLIVVHLGGGVSVAAHEKGKAVDVFNVTDEGSFSMDRAGGLPVRALIDYCFTGKSKAEIKLEFAKSAGVFSYLGTKDFREVVSRAFGGDDEAMEVFKALAYQLSKDIGAMAAVLRYRIDAVVLTGGMAYNEEFCREIKSYVEPLGKVLVLPGEEEMRSLAEGALRVLHGEPAGTY